MSTLSDLRRALIPVDPESWIIVTLIWASAFIAIVWLSRELWQIRKEGRNLVRWMGILRDTDSEAAISRIEATYAQSSDEPLPDLVTSGLQSICKARAGQADLEAICSMLAQSEARRLAIPTVIPNLLMLLGLLGTVLGLSSAIAPLSDQIMGAAKNVDPQMLAESLKDTLASMSSAFIATLWGISTAFVTGLYLRVVANGQDRLLEDVQDFIISDVSPRLLPKSREATIQDLSHAVKEVGSFMRRVPKLMEEAAVRFKETLEETSLDMKENLILFQSSANAMQTQLLSSGSDMKESADRLGAATETLTVASTDLEKYHADLRASHKEMLELYSQSRNDLEVKITEQLGAIDEFRKEVMRSTSEVIDKVSRASDRYEQCSADFKSAAEAAGTTVADYREAVAHRFSELQLAVEGLLVKHQGVAEGVGTELRELTGRLAPATLDREWDEMKRMIGQLDATFRSLNLSVGASGLEELASVADRLESAMKGYATSVRDSALSSDRPDSVADPLIIEELRHATQAMERVAVAMNRDTLSTAPEEPHAVVAGNSRLNGIFDGRIASWCKRVIRWRKV